MVDTCSVHRVYLCDDQRDYRTLLKTVLAEEDDLHVVGEGGDAGFCIEDAAEARPDAILLDVNMPGMNGIDAMPHLRKALPNAKVIVLTSANAREYEDLALRAGASGFIQKPRNIFDLPGMVRDKLAEAGLEI
jgi:DNA-binding NarL/FixJ family response regulator